VQDRRASNEGGGTFTSGAFRTRTVNYVVINNIVGVSLAASKITIPSGSYFIEALMAAFKTGGNYGRLYSVTDSVEILPSIQNYNHPTENTQQYCSLSGVFTISKTHVLELQHFCTSTYSTYGFGTYANGASFNIFLDCKVWRLA
jgi:hypothetical protein